MAVDPEIRTLLSRLDDQVADIPFANPISQDRLGQVLDALSLKAQDTILDIGARRCEFVIRLIERYGCRAVAVDNVEGFARAASERARGRISPDHLSAHEQTAAEFFAQNPARDHAATICVGSGHAFGDYTDMVRGLIPRTRAQGLMFVGYPFRKAGPGATDHDAHIVFASQLGLEVIMDWAATDEDWQAFHGTLLAGYERHAAAHPDDPDCRRFLDAEARPRCLTYLESIRSTTGFGYGLFRVADPASTS